VSVRLGHEPLLKLLGKENQGIEVADFSGTTGKATTENGQTGHDKGIVKQR
jgi:hypothetical protein